MLKIWRTIRNSIFLLPLLLLPQAASAHAEWFLDGGPHPDQSLPTVFWIFLLLAVGVLLVLRPLAVRPVGGKVVKVLHLQVMPFVGLAKNTWSIGLGAVLVLFAVRGEFFSPTAQADGSIDELMRIFILVAGLGFLTLVLRRYAAGLLLAAFALFWYRYGLIDLLLRAEYIGLGLAFLFGYQQGKFSLRYAMRYARVGLGVALLTGALYEKVFHPGISLAFLETHAWNFLSGFGVADLTFISLTAAVELFLGTLLVLNVFPRFAALVVLGTMLVTFVVLGSDELFGHIVSALIALFIAFFGTDYFHFTEEQEIEL